MLGGFINNVTQFVIQGLWAKFDVYILLILPLVVVAAVLHTSRKARVVAEEARMDEGRVIEAFRDMSRSKGEEACKVALEKIFKKPFVKSKPKCLENPATSGGKNKYYMELDLFNQETMVACEYNGKQHYVFTPHFHKTHKDFADQVERDRLKAVLCKENGITLISVPYTVKPHEIHAFIISELYKAHKQVG